MTQIVTIPIDEWEAFIPHLSEKTFEKHDFLIRAGEVAKNFYFITSGLARFFYSTVDGKEFNKHFVMENGFAGSFHSLILEAPCGFFIQALAKTTTILLPHNVMNAFYDRHPCWERLGRKKAEYMFLFKEAREKELLLDSLEVRWDRGFNSQPF